MTTNIKPIWVTINTSTSDNILNMQISKSLDFDRVINIKPTMWVTVNNSTSPSANLNNDIIEG
jgi:hypothetical protein